MASQETKILSPENVPMFTAVSFIIAVVALAFALVTYTRVRQATVGLALMQVAKVKGDRKHEATQNTRVDGIEKRISGLEARAGKMEQMAAAAAAPAAPAPTAKK